MLRVEGVGRGGRRRGDGSARGGGGVPRGRGIDSGVDVANDAGDAGDARVGVVTDERGGVTIVVDGHPQSYVDPADAGLLVFEYVQHLATCLDAMAPPAPAPLAVTHIGGAGLTLPRYVHHSRPGSPQIVLEPDAALTDRVRAALPLPRGHRIRVRAQLGRDGLADLRERSADAIVLDAYAQGCVPSDLTTVEALTICADVLRPGGMWLANLADEPARRYVARVAATADAAGLPQQALVATHDVLKGRRFGNSVLLASAAPLPLEGLRRSLARAPFPSGLWDGAELRRWRERSGQPGPFTDAAPGSSPAPPDPGRWRAR